MKKLVLALALLVGGITTFAIGFDGPPPTCDPTTCPQPPLAVK